MFCRTITPVLTVRSKSLLLLFCRWVSEYGHWDSKLYSESQRLNLQQDAESCLLLQPDDKHFPVNLQRFAHELYLWIMMLHFAAVDRNLMFKLKAQFSFSDNQQKKELAQRFVSGAAVQAASTWRSQRPSVPTESRSVSGDCVSSLAYLSLKTCLIGWNASWWSSLRFPACSAFTC